MRHVVQYLLKLWTARESPMRPILFRQCRSKKEYSDDGGSEMIGVILKAREAREKIAESLTNTWQRV